LINTESQFLRDSEEIPEPYKLFFEFMPNFEIIITKFLSGSEEISEPQISL